jgi:predicted RND superfamily exporter protein
LIATVGLLAASGQSFNLISNILPLLLLIIGVSNSVHVVARYVQEVDDWPNDRRRATRETFAHMAVACLLASLTTAIGFLSIAAARSEVLQDFGWQAVLGMAMLYLSTMLVLGVALPWFRPKRRSGDLSNRYSPTSHAVAIAGYAVARHPWPTLIVSLGVFVGSLWLARDCRINSYFLETFDADNPTQQTLVMVEENLAGIIPLEISLDADDHQRFLDPRNFKAIYDLQQFAVSTDAVTSAESYVNLFQELYWKARRTAEDRDRLPTLDAAGADRIEFCEQRILLSPRVFNYHAFMTKDGRRARILLRMRDAGTFRTLEVVEQLENKLHELLPADSGITFRLTGDAYVSAKAMDRFIRDIFYSLGAAAAVIFAIIGLLFRSLRLGLVAALPNMTPLAVTLGYMGLRGYEMNASNVIVFSISLGIAVDNTIHFLARFREEIRKTDDAAWAVEQTYEGTGKAIVLTTLLIICGLSVLLFSEFVPTRRVAELIGVSMCAALIGDLFLLPACLVLFWKKPKNADASPSVV